MNTMIVGNVEENNMQNHEFVDSICRCLYYLAGEAKDAGLCNVSTLLEQCAGNVQESEDKP